MKYIFFILAVFLLACRKETPQLFIPDPHDATRIEGHWADMTGTLAPDWHYHFDAGLLTQSYTKAGATLTSLTYPYAIRRDSVFIGGDATNIPRTWLLEFECEEVVMVTQSAAALGQRFWLKRE